LIGALVLVGAASAAWLIVPRRAPSEAGLEPHSNIILIVLDTVRADRVSCYGNERPTTPTLDRIAKRGTLFQAAQSVAPWTIPSMASLWSGVLPSQHGAGIPGEPKAFEGEGSYRGFNQTELPSLPVRLKNRGYRNFAYITNPLLNRMSCFLDGFDHRFCKVSFEKAEAAVTQVVSWVPELARSRPFFLYLHLMDAHQPLDPPPTTATCSPPMASRAPRSTRAGAASTCRST
jgi:hypothetical protein